MDDTVSKLRSQAAELRMAADALDGAADALVKLHRGGETNGKVGLKGDLTMQVRRRSLDDLPGIAAIRVVLSEAREPMKKLEILHEMAVRGKNMSPNTLDVYLSQDDDFESKGGGRWALKGK